MGAPGVAVAFARVRQPVQQMFDRAGITERVGEESTYLEADDVVDAFRRGGS